MKLGGDGRDGRGRDLLAKLGENRRRWRREKIGRESEREEQRSWKSGRGERSSPDGRFSVMREESCNKERERLRCCKREREKWRRNKFPPPPPSYARGEERVS